MKSVLSEGEVRNGVCQTEFWYQIILNRAEV